MPAVKRQPAALTNERNAVSVTTGSSAVAASICGAARLAGRSRRASVSAGAVGSAAMRPKGVSRGIGEMPIRMGDKTRVLAVAAIAKMKTAGVGMDRRRAITGCVRPVKMPAFPCHQRVVKEEHPSVYNENEARGFTGL
jgi:hypothetical protein